jgi:hypothetical protein
VVVVADASVAIRGDLSGYRRDLKTAERDTGTLGQKIQNILSPRNIVAGAGVLGIGLGLRNLVGYAGEAADAFSELQQTQRTTDEVFGDSAGVIEEWASRAAESAGMSQRTVFQSGSVMGQTLRNMGFSAEEAADKVVLLQQRAAEMGIAFGQTPERAILAITAAMRGERDTIEKFGVSIKQVDVNARVAAMGLGAATGEAKKNAEAMAILDLVLEQTNDQAGRFAEGQDDVAVKMAQANAMMDDFMATQLGPAVASIQLGALKVGGFLGDMATDVGMFFDNAFNPEKQAQLQALADGVGVSFSEMRDIVDREAAAAGRSWEEQLALMVQAADGGMAQVHNAVATNMGGVPSTIESYADEIRAASEKVAQIPANAIRAEWAETQEAAYQMLVEYHKGLLRGQNLPQIAFDAAMQLIEEEMTRAEEVAELKGNLLTLAHARGIAAQEGKTASVQAIDSAIALIQGRLDALGVNAYVSGTNVGYSLAAGMNASLGVVKDAAGNVAAAATGQLQIRSEPPDADSPLRGITQWGGNIAKTIADGMLSGTGYAASAASALAGSLVPSVSGGGAMGAMSGGGGGNTYQVYIDSLPEYPTLREIGGELRRLGEIGKLPGAR